MKRKSAAAGRAQFSKLAGTQKSSSGGAVRRWSLYDVKFAVKKASKKCRGKTGPVFEARRHPEIWIRRSCPEMVTL